MGAGTKSTWPDETPDEVIERVRREHGDKAAAIVAKTIAGPVPSPGRRKPGTEKKVGRPFKPGRGIPTPKRRLTRAEATEMVKLAWQRDNERHKGRPGYNRSGLPSSGAPRADRGRP